jgi:membrane-bound lytic murein transglycosylase D
MSGSVEIALGRMTKYYDMITDKLEAKEMPRDLVYLAMIESDFDPNARSHAHAVGMWQFMAPTARRFGLEVRGRVDERKDPERATDAALAYLGKLHDRFGSWYLAAAAYNSGEGTVSRALKRVTGKGTGTDADFFKILNVLPRETQDYVPKLIAAAKIGNAPAEYGILPRGLTPAAGQRAAE